MKYFTPELIERFGSADDRLALAVHEEFDNVAEQYEVHLRGLEPKLPPRFRELQQSFYLHDARLTSPWQMPPGPCFLPPSKPEASFWLALRLDTPPREFVVLHYRSATVEEAHHDRLRWFDPCPYLEWLYDEVEVLSTPGGDEFVHSILFTNGVELRLRFTDFDFATLKPLAQADEPAPAGVPPSVAGR